MAEAPHGDDVEEAAPTSLQIPKTPEDFDSDATYNALLAMVEAAKKGEKRHPYCVCSFFPLNDLITNALAGNLFQNISSSSPSTKIAKALTRYLYQEITRIHNSGRAGS